MPSKTRRRIDDFEELEEMDEMDELEAINERLRGMDIDELQRDLQQTKRDWRIFANTMSRASGGRPVPIIAGDPDGDRYSELLKVCITAHGGVREHRVLLERREELLQALDDADVRLNIRAKTFLDR